MDGLQRSAVSFRRQGSSGLVWDDRFLSGELNQVKTAQQEGETKQQQQLQQEEQQGQRQLQDNNNNQEKADVVNDVKPARNVAPINTMERSRSNGERRGYRTGRVSPAIEPPSPKVSACGFCSAFGGKQDKNHRKKPGKRKSR